MKRAGIVTLFGEYNFGNRLQNYAVQQILKKHGLDVETIKYIGLEDDVPVVKNERDENRLAKFKEFNEYIKFANEIMYKEYEAPKIFCEDYDYIVMGSDQIWNFTFDKIFSDKALGSFVPEDKRVSFSASFGVNYAPKKDSDLYTICKNNLQNMKAISVREFAGRDIVKELTGRDDITVLIDPTMMLEDREWELVMKKPEKLKADRFILKSFLGNVSDKTWSELRRIAQENDCEIIDISNKNSPYYDMGPAEFLYLEKNAFLVATDSFHACVFSILFSTPFVVFKRQDNELESMYSRIETLLEKFEMPNRIFNNKITEDILNSDYSRAYEILKEERIKADEFINNAFA